MTLNKTETIILICRQRIIDNFKNKIDIHSNLTFRFSICYKIAMNDYYYLSPSLYLFKNKFNKLKICINLAFLVSSFLRLNVF